MPTLLQQTRFALGELGIRPHKHLGQHFLIDADVVYQMVQAARLGPETVVLEIGPGLGVVSDVLVDACARLYLVELDSILADKENNHPWNQKAKELLLQLRDDDVDWEYDSRCPYNQVSSNQLYVLQLMEWGLNTSTGRWYSELPSDEWEWTESERMMKWRDKQRQDGQYAFADLQIVEEQMISFILDMTPKQIMLYLMAFPGHHPEEAICGEMSVFEEADDPSTGAIFLLHTVSEITKTAATLLWKQTWWTTWW